MKLPVTTKAGSTLAPVLAGAVDLLKCPQDPTKLEDASKLEREIKTSAFLLQHHVPFLLHQLPGYLQDKDNA